MRKAMAVWLLVAALLSSGCWDRTEIEDAVHVSSFGVDEAGDELLWTFRLVEAEQLPVGMLTLPPPQMKTFSAGLITVRASSLEQAIQLVQASMYRIVSLQQTHGIVFGEDLARKGIGPIINQLQRHNQWRNTVVMQVGLGSALDIMRSDVPLGDINPVKIPEGILLVEKRMHLSPPIRLQHFYGNMLDAGSDPFAPLVAVNPMASRPLGAPLPPMGDRSLKAGEFPRTGGNPIEFAGTAVFHGDKLKGTLTVDESAALLALRGEMGKVYASMPDPLEEGMTMTLRYHQENKPKYEIAFVRGRPVVDIYLQLEGELLSSPGKTDYSSPVNRRQLEQVSARYLEKNTYLPLVQKLYGEWGADPVGLGNLYRRKFPTFDSWLNYRWRDHSHQVKVNVHITLLIRRFGLLLQNPLTGHRTR